MARRTKLLVTGLLTIAPVPQVSAAERPYLDPTVIAAGSAWQMASWAKAAIQCGFEIVTVRPWKEGDIRPARFITHPRVLVVQAANESSLDKVMNCFGRKTGVQGEVIS